jgi:hypothetical protein
MIAYFVKADRECIGAINAVLRGSNGLSTLAKSISPTNFGEDLTLILVKLIAESDLLLRFPPKMSVGRYREEERSTNVTVPITKSMLRLSRGELRSQILQLTCNAIDLIDAKFAEDLDTDFAGLKAAFVEAVSLPDDFDWSVEPEPERFWE